MEEEERMRAEASYTFLIDWPNFASFAMVISGTQCVATTSIRIGAGNFNFRGGDRRVHVEIGTGSVV